jgi:uncharacterized protein YcfJ
MSIHNRKTLGKKILSGAVSAVFLVASAGAVAQDQRYDDRYEPGYDSRRDDRPGHRYDDRYGDGSPVYEYAKVIDVQPLTRQVRVSAPQRECWDETRVDPGYNTAGYGGPRTPAGGALLGAVIGGVLGHQIGSGRGRDATTAAGVVIGAGLGHQQAQRRIAAANAPPPPAREYTVQRCETRYTNTVEERIDGYRVTYVYNGRRQVTEMPYKPGDRIRVRVDVSPAE